jgi:hypothetical protein
MAVPIPESQLQSWSKFVASQISKQTADSIRDALGSTASSLRGRLVEVYLQGSYKNETNLRGDSDVDVVAQLNSVFHHDVSALSMNERICFEAAYSDSTYDWRQFRADVLATLRAYFGSSKVDDTGNKALRVVGQPGSRLDADVLVCLQYRKYRYFRSPTDQDYVEGVRFFTMREGREVINWPKEHYQNGVKKQAQTRDRYKPTVRMFKNARNYLVGRERLAGGLAPSYFVEGLLYNVPATEFQDSFQSTYLAALRWICQQDLTSFTCQNQQLPLFGNTPEQWNTDQAIDFISALIDLYGKWY